MYRSSYKHRYHTFADNLSLIDCKLLRFRWYVTQRITLETDTTCWDNDVMYDGWPVRHTLCPCYCVESSFILDHCPVVLYTPSSPSSCLQSRAWCHRLLHRSIDLLNKQYSFYVHNNQAVRLGSQCIRGTREDAERSLREFISWILAVGPGRW